MFAKALLKFGLRSNHLLSLLTGNDRLYVPADWWRWWNRVVLQKNSSQHSGQMKREYELLSLQMLLPLSLPLYISTFFSTVNHICLWFSVCTCEMQKLETALWGYFPKNHKASKFLIFVFWIFCLMLIVHFNNCGLLLLKNGCNYIMWFRIYNKNLKLTWTINKNREIF